MKHFKLSTVILLLCFFCTSAFAQSGGKMMPFQGNFFENGLPVTGNRTFTFTIELGDNDWTETQSDVQIIEGLYSVTLGSINPIPEDIFYEAESRVLTVAVGNTTLGSTEIFAPFALNDGQNFGEGVFRLETTSEADSIALIGEIYGAGYGNLATGIKGIAQTDTTENVGVWGIAKGSESNNRFQTAIYGEATSLTADAWSTGVWGVGSGNGGSVTYGVRGEARGTETSFSAAARGLNFSTTPATGGSRYGGYFNTYPSDSLLTGESIGVRGLATGSQYNYGSSFNAYNAGEVNYGIWAGASGANENYSGWFDGGKFILHNVSELNFWGENDYISLRVNGEDWNTDTRGYAKMDLRGPSGQNIYLGAKAWEEGGADKATLQMWGQPLSYPGDTTGATYQQIFMEVASQNNGDGEQGYIILRKEGQGDAFLNYDILRGLIDNQNQTAFANLSVRSQNPITDEFGNTYYPDRINLNIGQDGAGTEFGTLNLSNSAGGGYEIGSRAWENNNQGGANTYTAILSTIDFTNSDGITYRPWILSQQLHNNVDGDEYGTLSIRSVNSNEDLSKVDLNPDNTGDINIAGSLNQSSDARLKKNITSLTSGLATIKQLRGVRYNWKNESMTGDKIGFIAQEVEKVLPELVITKEDGYKAVSYAEMTAVLVEAVKELSAQVESLKVENSELKAEASKVTEMEDRLAKIEALLLSRIETTTADQK